MSEESPIDRIVNARMSSPAPGGAPPPGRAPEAPPAPPPEAPGAGPTPQEQAAEKGSPVTEGDKVQEPATTEPSEEDLALIELKIGENPRKFTPKQLERALTNSFQHTRFMEEMAPINEITRAIMERTGQSPAEVAKFLKTAITASAKNPTMGNRDNEVPNKAGQPDSPNDLDAELSTWENETAASLPPGYRDLLKGSQSTQATLQQLTQMVQQIAQGNQATTENQTTTQADAYGRTITNNLMEAAREHGISEAEAEDFKAFFSERGYVAEDFLSKRLTQRVMQDFANQRSSPEAKRLIDIHKRRLAAMGSMGAAPAAQPGQTQEDPQMATINRLATRALEKRG